MGQKFLELLLISARYSLCCQVPRLCSALSYCGNLLLSPRTTHGTQPGLLPFSITGGWHCSPLSALSQYYHSGQNEHHNIALQQAHPHMPLGFTNTTLFTLSWKTVCKPVTLLSSFEESYFDVFEHWIGLCPLLRPLFSLKNFINYLTRPVPCQHNLPTFFLSTSQLSFWIRLPREQKFSSLLWPDRTDLTHAQGIDVGIWLFWMNTDTYSRDSCSATCLQNYSKKEN